MYITDQYSSNCVLINDMFIFKLATILSIMYFSDIPIIICYLLFSLQMLGFKYIFLLILKLRALLLRVPINLPQTTGA
jgi:hypothetical protein